MIARKGVAFLQCLYLRLCAMAGVPAELAGRTGRFAHADTHLPSPIPGLGPDLNKSGTTNDTDHDQKSAHAPRPSLLAPQ